MLMNNFNPLEFYCDLEYALGHQIRPVGLDFHSFAERNRRRGNLGVFIVGENPIIDD
jgi:hypothetical protein